VAVIDVDVLVLVSFSARRSVAVTSEVASGSPGSAGSSGAVGVVAAWRRRLLGL